MKKKVLVARPTFPDVIERLSLKQYFDVDVNLGDVLPADEFARRLADRDGTFTAGEWVGENELTGAPNLKVVANMAVGYNNFDMHAFDAHGVLGTSTNTPNVLRNHRRLRLGADDGGGAACGRIGPLSARGKVAEVVVRFVPRQRRVRFDARRDRHGTHRVGARAARGRLRHAGDLPQPLARLARERSEIERRIRFEGRPAQACGPCRARAAVHEGKPSHDRRRRTRAEKPTATLTNIARGGIVDDTALIQAFRDKRIAAALDVFEGEPNFDPDFLVLDNVVLTPHIASATENTRRAMANLIAGLGEGPRAGNPPNPINPDVLKK